MQEDEKEEREEGQKKTEAIFVGFAFTKMASVFFASPSLRGAN